MAKKKTDQPKRMLGATASPRHCLAAAKPHEATAYPAEFGIVPKNLNAYGNDRYGNCVTAEEAYAKAVSSIMAGVDQLCPTADEVIKAARDHRALNGANLTDVMDWMAADGMSISGKVWKDGPYQSVNWEDRDALCSAISQGPVKIGVAHLQIQAAHDWTNGWILTGARKDRGIDHCVVLLGYGKFGYLAKLCGITLPKKYDANTFGYLMGTWSTIGLVDEDSMRNVTGEAWLRIPTTPGLPAPIPVDPPLPEPPPIPGPSPGPQPAPGPTPVPGNLDQRIAAILAEIQRREAAGDGAGAERIVAAAENATRQRFAPCGGPVRDISERVVEFLDGVQPSLLAALAVAGGPELAVLKTNAMKASAYTVGLLADLAAGVANFKAWWATISPTKKAELLLHLVPEQPE